MVVGLFTTVDLSVLLMIGEPRIGKWPDDISRLEFSSPARLESEGGLEAPLVWLPQESQRSAPVSLSVFFLLRVIGRPPSEFPLLCEVVMQSSLFSCLPRSPGTPTSGWDALYSWDS